MSLQILSPESSQQMVKNFSQISMIRQSTETQERQFRKLKPTTNRSLFDSLYLCHRTNYFPVDGILSAFMKRSHSYVNKYASQIAGGMLPEISRLFSTFARTTVHFTLNSLVQDHAQYKSSGDFLIIDPIKKGSSQIVGGLVEDLFCIGPYELSDEATVLAPDSLKNDPDFKQKLRTLSKQNQIIYYAGKIEDFFKKWLKENQIPEFIEKNEDPNSYNFFYQVDDKHYIATQTVLAKLGKVFCSHDITPMYQIETYLTPPNLFFYATPPFYESLRSSSYQEKIKVLGKYCSAIEQAFPLSTNQKAFLKSREKVFQMFLKMFYRSSSTQDLIASFILDKECYIAADNRIDLSKKIDRQTTSQKLAELTGMPFQAYFRNNCETIVDAACKIELDPTHIPERLNQLTQRFDLDFMIQKHREIIPIISEEPCTSFGEKAKLSCFLSEKTHTYAVVKNINFSEIADKIGQISKQKIVKHQS